MKALVEDAAGTDGEANGSLVKSKDGVKMGPGGPGGARPPLRKLRRRSTLEWINATPQRRQERLEKVAAERLAEAVFFSLHVRGFEGW